MVIITNYDTNRLILREMLTSRGAEVSEAEDGPQGLLLLERARLCGRPFKLLLLDCRMPGMDGFQVADRIKAAGYDGMPILMLTSDDLKIELARVGQLGLDAYLVKPVRRLELFEAIAAAMALHSGDFRSTLEQTAAQSTGAAGSPARSLHILLAEDARDNRILIRAYLKNSRARIDEAENGLIAVEKAQAEKYDLILMDIQMPVMDGLEAIRLIRQRERHNGSERVPIIALTASALESDVRRSLDAGADLHVSKPVKKATLLAAIESVTLVSSGSARDAGRAESHMPGRPRWILTQASWPETRVSRRRPRARHRTAKHSPAADLPGWMPIAAFCPDDRCDIRSTTTKRTGTRKIAKPLENTMPTMVTVPIRRRATAPAPRAVHSGIRPKMNANEVIRIGLRRWRAPFSAAVTSASPCSSSALANSTIRIAFFAESPINMMRPICA